MQFTFVIPGPGDTPSFKVTLELQGELDTRPGMVLLNAAALAVQATLADALTTFDAALPAPAPPH